jgi:hypothetical protein
MWIHAFTINHAAAHVGMEKAGALKLDAVILNMIEICRLLAP